MLNVVNVRTMAWVSKRVGNYSLVMAYQNIAPTPKAIKACTGWIIEYNNIQNNNLIPSIRDVTPPMKANITNTVI